MNDEAVVAYARQAVAQWGGTMVQQVLSDAIGPARAKYPDWGLKLTKVQVGDASAAKPEQGVVRIPKDITKVRGASEALQYATMIGLLTSPVARVMLVACGYRLEFVQFPGVLVES